jgi:hypothetical protein
MRARDQLLERLIFLEGGLEIVVVMVVIGIVMASGQLASGEQLSRELAWAAIMVFGLPYLAYVIPALTFAFMNRYLPLAAALCALLPPITFGAFVYA